MFSNEEAYITTISLSKDLAGMSDVSAGEVTYHGKVRYRTGASPTDVSAGTEAAGTFVLTYKIHSN